MATAYFTICARNYLAYALTLKQSLLKAEPKATLYIFLADLEFEADPPTDNIVPAEDLDLPDLADMAMRYSVMEFATAIKPFCFNYLFDKHDAQQAVYLDPDIYVLAPFDHVSSAFNRGVSAVLTPHLDAPLPDDGFTPSTEDIRRSGVFNLGFAGFANSQDARMFIDWWAVECAKNCFSSPDTGHFVDQLFVDMAPGFVSNLCILRHAGYNAAYWNLGTRPVARAQSGGWTAGDDRLHFFHFSGVSPGDPNIVSKHQTRFSRDNIGELTGLLDEYLAGLSQNRHAAFSKIPYGYGHYDDGVAIPTPARRAYADAVDAGEHRKPFGSDRRYLHQKADPVDQTMGAPITTFMFALWKTRPDLQAVFPLSTARGRRGFHAWFLEFAQQEYDLSAEFHSAASNSLGGIATKIAKPLLKNAPPSVQTKVRRMVHGD